MGTPAWGAALGTFLHGPGDSLTSSIVSNLNKSFSRRANGDGAR